MIIDTLSPAMQPNTPDLISSMLLSSTPELRAMPPPYA